MIDLVPSLDNNNSQPLYVQLYKYIKDEIMNDRIDENEKLPSIRQLSKNLHISRTTIENAYQQLLVEGYVYSIPKSGYFASSFDKKFVNDIEEQTQSIMIEQPCDAILYDFKNEYVEEDNFDFNLWKKYINQIFNYETQKLYTVTHAQGELELRKEIIKYVRRSRGVSGSIDRIIIGGGVQYLLNILSTILKKNNIIKCAFEDPGFNRAKNIFSHNDFDILPIPVNDKGIDLDILSQSDAKLCYVSPSHQFPTGSVMSINQRIKLLKWAKENNGYIIEDDYNSELRYYGKPIPSMQSFDKDGKVIYLGSFSTVLVPSIRISYMILPMNLYKLYNESKYRYTQTASKTEQLALAKFMNDGMFEKHIRKLKKNYAKKNQLIIGAVKKYMGNNVKIGGVDSGLHLLLQLQTDLIESEVINKALENKIRISGISEYRIINKDYKNPIILLSYRGISIHKIDEAINLLSKIIK